MNTVIQLDPLDLAFSLAFVAGAIALSRLSNLGLEGQIAIAAGRTILQLLAAGYLLAFVFSLNAGGVLVALAVMITLAAIATQNRIAKKLKRLFPWIWGSFFLSSALTLSYIILLLIQPPVWYEPQYLIPLAGIIIANAMDAATLTGERLVSSLQNSPLEIETYLSLGATPQQAISRYRKEAIRASLLPSLNRMMVVGLVALPGTLNGQILGGSNPFDAALYQIVLLLAIAFANLVSVLLVARGISQQFFNRNAQYIR